MSKNITKKNSIKINKPQTQNANSPLNNISSQNQSSTLKNPASSSSVKQNTTNSSSTINKSNKPTLIKVKANPKEDIKTEYNKKLLGIDVSQVKGIFPIMLNFNKIMSVLRSKNVKVTPSTSYKLLGEYVNKHNGIDESFEEKIETHKDLIQLNNDFETMIKAIKILSEKGKITPNSIITVINNLILFYNEANKQELLIHYAYLAEIIYKHFSTLMDNTEINRNDFFENDMVLDINAVMECVEFYYTDIYMLNSDEKAELINTIKSYYLEEVMKVKNERNKANEESKAAIAQLEANKIEEQKAEEERIKEEKKKKTEQEKLNSNKLKTTKPTTT
jgi:hypothetical protein